MKTSKKENKGVVVTIRYPMSVVFLIDEEAEKEGSSRSHILRRIAMKHVKDQVPATLQEVS